MIEVSIPVQSAPMEPGFYWAATSEKFRWYNMIVEAYGDPPYMKLRAWNRLTEQVIALEPSNLKLWGPRIEEVKP